MPNIDPFSVDNIPKSKTTLIDEDSGKNFYAFCKKLFEVAKGAATKIENKLSSS